MTKKVRSSIIHVRKGKMESLIKGKSICLKTTSLRNHPQQGEKVTFKSAGQTCLAKLKEISTTHSTFMPV